MLERRWKLPSSQYSFLEKTKRLDLRRNQAFHNASGGDKRDRTADLLNAIQALSQLSYTPMRLSDCESYFSKTSSACQAPIAFF